MSKLVENIIPVKIFNEDSQNFTIFQEKQSTELVPGDIFVIDHNMKLPCDCILISGDILLNEQSLTGETLPIPKVPLEPTQETFDLKKNHKRNTLLEGTVVIKSRPLKHQFALGLVIRTGFCSFKGQIFRSILYPVEKTQNFYQNIFIFCMGLLTITMISGIFYAQIMKQNGFATWMILMSYINIIIQNLPPQFPLYINSTCDIVMKRLKANKIICMDVHKILPASDIDICCFDKTGTLTIQEMQTYSITDELFQESKIQGQNYEFQYDSLLQKQFASCHGIHVINNQLIGDQLDISMFNLSQWVINENQSTHQFIVSNKENTYKLEILKFFEFESEYQRMSCIVKDLNTQELYFFIKGSPEIIKSLCPALQNNEMYNLTIEQLSLKGLRLISFGYKKIQNIPQQQILELQRQQLECDIVFNGILSFQNKLKDDTFESIKTLQNSNYECRVISGDNPLTTIQTARQSGMIPSYQNVLLYELDNSQNLHCQEIPALSLDFSKIQQQHQKVIIVNESQPQSIYNQHEIGITGPALNYILNEKTEENQKILTTVLAKGKIFSRIKPQQKSLLINLFQQQQKKVLMIGDGSNDCAAIKQADVGVSFTSSDAGLSATFSGDETESISIVIEILKNGKSTMQNVIDIIKAMLVFGMIIYIASFITIPDSAIYQCMDIQDLINHCLLQKQNKMYCHCRLYFQQFHQYYLEVQLYIQQVIIPKHLKIINNNFLINMTMKDIIYMGIQQLQNFQACVFKLLLQWQHFVQLPPLKNNIINLKFQLLLQHFLEYGVFQCQLHRYWLLLQWIYMEKVILYIQTITSGMESQLYQQQVVQQCYYLKYLQQDISQEKKGDKEYLKNNNNLQIFKIKIIEIIKKKKLLKFKIFISMIQITSFIYNRLFAKPPQIKETQILPGKTDNYNVYHIEQPNLKDNYKDPEILNQIIKNTVEQQIKEGKKAIWFKIHQDSIYLSNYALNNGFKMHHSESDSVMFFKWLKTDSPCNLPSYCTHMTGAGGAIINKNQEILLVQEKTGNRKNLWNIPMGRVDEGELIYEGAIREVYEETGLETELSDLILMREQPSDTFGKPDIFFIFLLKLKNENQEVQIQDQEVQNFKWVKLQDLKELVQQEPRVVPYPTQSEFLLYIYELQQNGFQFYKDKIFNTKFLTHNNKQFNVFLAQNQYIKNKNQKQ